MSISLFLKTGENADERERDIYVQTMKNVISLCSICHFCLHFIIYLFQEILTHTHTHILNLHVESHCNMCKMVKTKFVSLRGPLSAPDCFDISSRLSTDTVESCRVCICRSRVYPWKNTNIIYTEHWTSISLLFLLLPDSKINYIWCHTPNVG